MTTRRNPWTQDYTERALSLALEAGWEPYGVKINGEGRLCFGLLLGATGEVLWFDEPHLATTFLLSHVTGDA